MARVALSLRQDGQFLDANGVCAAPIRSNARRHSRAQIKQIAKSIETFGFTNPILVSDDLEDPRRTRPRSRSEVARND